MIMIMMIGPGRLLSKEHTTLHKMGAAAAEIKELDDEADCLFDSLRLKQHGIRAGPGRAHCAAPPGRRVAPGRLSERTSLVSA
jgi:hypothetical protein